MADEVKTGEHSPEDIIQIDPQILGGRPFVRGTRLPVEFLQGLTGIGWSQEKILEVYAYISPAELERALAHRATP